MFKLILKDKGREVIELHNEMVVVHRLWWCKIIKDITSTVSSCNLSNNKPSQNSRDRVGILNSKILWGSVVILVKFTISPTNLKDR